MRHIERQSRRLDRMVQKDSFVYIMIFKSGRPDRMVQKDSFVYIMIFKSRRPDRMVRGTIMFI